MKNPIFRIIYVFLICIVVVILTSLTLFSNDFKKNRAITADDTLTGQRIGVLTAYSTDYLLADRTDITLKRYDSEGDLLLAICYGQVDAAAVDESTYVYFKYKTDGMTAVEGLLPDDHLCAVLYQGNAEFNEEFNAFTKEFMNSDTYLELTKKFRDGYYCTDGNPPLEETGTGKTIYVGYNDAYEPNCFLDLKTGKASGYECDVLRAFANKMNYRIEFKNTTETLVYNDLATGNIDLACLGYSDIYRSEFESTELYDLSQPYLDSKTVLMVVEDRSKLSIAKAMEDLDE